MVFRLPPRLLRSQVFEVSGGLDMKRIRIHGGLLGWHSEYLWWEVNDVLARRKDQRIVIDGHDSATVGRFAQFLYTGSYEAPGPVKISDVSRKGAMQDSLSSHPEIVPAKDITTQECETRPCPTEVSPNSTRSGLGIAELSDSLPFDEPPVYNTLGDPASELPAIDPPEAPQSTLTPEDKPETASEKDLPATPLDKASHLDSSEFDFKDAFLAHGKTCGLAHYLDIELLEELAIERLEGVFSKITSLTPESRVASNFAELVGYAYESSKSKKLREALLKFFSPNVSALMGLELQKMVSRGGDLALDLMGIFWPRVEGLERENGQLLLGVKTLDGKLKSAEMNQEQAEVQVKQGRTRERGWKRLCEGMCGKVKELIVVRGELKEAQQLAEKEKSENEVLVVELHEHRGLIENLQKEKGMLMLEIDTTKQNLAKVKEKISEYRMRDISRY
ncbi:hypothetical protein B9Z19DRAFT_1120901 [Tuber borchii]|uniref:BTB domain-containing protein n=1 Tax=Tuber borchii TaxID=42251 RepID=A0A2T7A3U6_TUBBO|nr:hypothetical protein B9Z19DRAFT_1120901 [Tuber borchii]